MKKVILSFDYELFFGERSGTVDNSIIRPTELLLNKLDKINGKATFFVDYLMIKYLEAQPKTTKEARKITTQLQEIVQQGHRIELHIHPHWIDARYNGDGTWDFKDFTHYSLNSLPEDTVSDLFTEGCEMLNKIAGTVDPSYKVVAFRAGGWAVQPFSHLHKAFKKANIKIDSSVSCGFRYKGNDSFYDFTHVPDKPVYTFKDDVLVEDKDGEFVEFPISSYEYTFPMRIINSIHRYINPGLFRQTTDGTHSRISYGTLPTKIRKNSSILSRFTLSRLSPYVLLYALKKEKKELLVFLDHPKDFTYSALSFLTLLEGNVEFHLYTDFIDH
ncbi:hypothetical protein [Parabacteroides chongii]|uniref:hypothetical protein n=1 Tax=Parabacteroides chongii TaxID=2685834 RepID=UPI00240D5FA5|nr:hypothetical protein [Parabacteroides chongii]WFE84651.1 hypothetical protein P3L47_21420 [Parabacteroides chongii]